MDLILPYSIKPFERQIAHQDKILMAGSCFSQHIGDRLLDNKWQVLINPLGNIFNPYSIFKILRGEFDPEQIIEVSGRFSHWDAHGDVSFPSRDELVSFINTKGREIGKWTTESDWIIVTLGTAFVYEYLPSGQIVANCHKVPQSNFRKRLMSDQEIIENFNSAREQVRKANPKTRWLFTVSPVKHLNDGITENHISKGILLKAVYDLVRQHENVYYFPAYELVTDVLRDYRFYEKDMAHPNALAVEFVWEKFLESVISEDGKKFILRWKHIRQALNHKPTISGIERTPNVCKKKPLSI